MGYSIFVHLIFTSVLGAGLVAGIFFAFSTFVMPALARIPVPQGIAAMQSINIKAINFLFMLALFGTGAACLLVVVTGTLQLERSGSGLAIAGALCYLAGVVLVTMFANVPRNNALAAVDASTPAGAEIWAEYLRTWTAWNHVRTVAGLAAAVLLMLAFHATHVHVAP